MASKTDLPAYSEYVAPVLTALRTRGGSATIEEIEEAVAEIMDLPADLLAVPHGNGPRTQFQYELAWVRTYLKKVGALQNSERGIWSLTEIGERMTNEEARQDSLGFVQKLTNYGRLERDQFRLQARRSPSLMQRTQNDLGLISYLIP